MSHLGDGETRKLRNASRALLRARDGPIKRSSARIGLADDDKNNVKDDGIIIMKKRDDTSPWATYKNFVWKC